MGLQNSEVNDVILLEHLRQIHQEASCLTPSRALRRKLLRDADPVFQRLSESSRRRYLHLLAKRVREETTGVLTLDDREIDCAVRHATLRVGLVPKEKSKLAVYLHAAVFAALGATMHHVSHAA